MPKEGLAILLAILSLPASARTWNVRTDWGARGNGRTDDSPAIQHGISAMTEGDTVVFPPGTYYLASTVLFSAGGIRVTCQPGATLAGPNNGTDIFANLQSNTTIGGSAKTGCIFDGGGIQAYGKVATEDRR
jgi:polygalacturonase